MSWDWTTETRDRLESFLHERNLLGGALQIKRIGDGHSNLTYLVSDGEREVVVRRPPPPPLSPGAHDVLREARLIQALGETDVPVAKILAVGQKDTVLDVPFYVMDYVPGVVITEETPGALASAEHRRALGEAMVDRLADLHSVDWRGLGLQDFGRPEGFNLRHLRRIGALLGDGARPVGLEEMQGWLEAHAPPESGACIIHNDYRIGNVMWSPLPPVKMLAILDWELATIGDPLLDLGYFLANYPQAGEPRTPTQDFASAVLEPGYPGRTALLERYAARTGRDIANIGWHIAACEWKLAVFYEYARRRGVDRYYADPDFVPRYLAAARRAAGLAQAQSAM